MRFEEFIHLYPSREAVAVEANTEHARALFEQRRLNDSFDHAQRSKLNPVWINEPDVVRHNIMTKGEHSTHIPGPRESLLECRAATSAALDDFLNDVGLLRQTPVPELTERSLIRNPQRDEGEDDPVSLPQSSLRPTEANIMDAFSNYLSGHPHAEAKLWRLVLFLNLATARAKMTGAGDRSISPEDTAQVATIIAWQSLPSFRGDSSQFYAWAKKIGSRTAAKGLTANLEHNKTHLPLQVEGVDGVLDDNPLLYKKLEDRTFARELPESITGNDRFICLYIREGLTYKGMGNVLGLSESAVKQRVAAMREIYGKKRNKE
ncbi:RNA polymerase sigma factor [Granulicella paludicola]|uniref:RNA polymerase sigma factor n=1 Tax=Granulicella paludicola TaxID=474951 RepID=UPI0021DF8F31|nr:sigma factor [Granulicella paludicola]